ncbi:MAG: winged helix DNA-binding protein [Deltaproteobacteria bacterium]|nr:winged helix DNA-binding protein [Deltaproteobacteria bacterium]
MASVAYKPSAEENSAAILLEFFYPFHYKGGMALEDALRCGQLSRKQVAILWLIRAEGEQGKRMRRKDIERSIQTWFEVSSSAITKALRSMARPPLSLVQILEDPQSAREKQVLLTPKGESFLGTMVTEGQKFLQKILEQLTPKEVSSGIHFLERSIAAQEHILSQSPGRNGKKR